MTGQVATFTLREPVIAASAEITPIGGVPWPREIAAPVPAGMPGVALFDVDDAGELQEWEPRGELATFVGKCPRAHRVRVRCTVPEMQSSGWQVRCGSCTRWTVMSAVHARVVQGIRCGSRCRNAIGEDCSCECGGANHGHRFTVPMRAGRD